MTCKKCNLELPEFGRFCPHCGADQEESVEMPAVEEALTDAVEPAEEMTTELTEAVAPEDGEVLPEEETAEPAEEETDEQTEEASVPARKKLKLWQRIVLIVCCVALAAAAVFLALNIAGVDLKPRENDIYRKDSYTATTEQLQAKADEVVATVGDKTLTVGELQMHYQSAFYAFYSQNMYYISMLGLDLSQPLDQQTLPTTDGVHDPMTWQQYFIEAALDNWESYVRLEIEAENAQFQMNAELSAVLDNMEENALEMATASGYATVDEWLLNAVAPGVTLHDYTRYNRAYYMGNDYLSYYYETNMPTGAQIEAYYDENEAVFQENGITKDMGLNASVRHILIQPKNGTTDESGNTTYSEEEWAAARAEAERILQEWKDGAATEESFTELANTYSEDPGVTTNSGLYEDINVDASYLTEFKEWASDASRKAGDTDIVETSAGYHIMYFISGEEYWLMLAGEQVIADQIQAALRQNIETYPIEVTYKNILVGELMLG